MKMSREIKYVYVGDLIKVICIKSEFYIYIYI